MKPLIKKGIWLYLILLIFEGALRKWVLPGAQEVLLIVRDPVLLGIYALAVFSGIVPRSAFLSFLVALVGASFVASFLAGQTNILVTLYGLRTNYLHVPLIWIMAEVLDREDVERIGSFVLIMVIPMMLVMAKQFRSPMNAFINRGVGGDEVGQIYGALGRIRPPGFFAFITGPMVFFPLAAAFFMHQATTGRRLWLPVVAACGVALFIAMPVSISRGTMIMTGLVAAIYLVGMGRLGLINTSLIRFGVVGVLLLLALSLLPIFNEARDVFMSRWDTAAAEAHGDAWGSLTSRVLSNFTLPFQSALAAPFFGHGVGVGSNVGARLLSGQVGFLLAEDEWGKIFLELGPILGGAFIGFRVALTGYLLLVSTRALLRDRDPLPLGIWAACSPVILFHQWAPPTLLGFAVIGGGLVLASLNRSETDEEEEEADDDEEDDEEEEDEEEEDETPSEVELQRRRMRGL